MEYLLEITRIVDGAVKGDRAKVAAYVEQLARKLVEAGETQAAERLLRALRQVKASDVAPARFDATARLPVDGESRLALADEERIDPASIQIVLDPGTSQLVDEFVRFVRAADKLMASRVGIAPSMIIYGSPGVGKTELARYIAAQLGLPLITARSDSVISSFLGSTAKNLRVLFEHARSRPCVLFLDELDSLAKLRDDQHELGELKRVVVSLLQNIDALNNEVVLLGATNHHHLLDPAVWRRFAYRLELGLPHHGARQRLFELFLKGFPCDDELEALAAAAEGLSGADIRQVCDGAIRAAVVAGRPQVHGADILRTVARARLGETVDFGRTEPAQIRAVHELAPAVFTCKRLASVFDTSEPTVSRRLNEAGVTYGRGRRKKASDQGRHPAGSRSEPTAARRRA